ncbi:lipase family protein [Xanthomonas graminis]|uniref:lipase family protein n=1 Tax=Xanthomonas graminis TaxID=3390026 RepID=UPI000B2F71FF|nr:hypothetical protein [Xanthomonas translucens]
MSAGFYRIYDGKSGSMRVSMREQVFALLAHFAPRQVYVTGHSLGGALSKLFSLDLALSQPAVRACNINFCSPMVGEASWGQAYAQSIAAADSTRCFNHRDYVPSLPPSTFDYVPVGQEFRTAYDVRGALFAHLLSRHAIVNMQTVLRHALPLTPQVWSGTFPDYADPRRLMLSQVPPMQAHPAWADVELAARASERLPGFAPGQPAPASVAG